MLKVEEIKFFTKKESFVRVYYEELPLFQSMVGRGVLCRGRLSFNFLRKSSKSIKGGCGVREFGDADTYTVLDEKEVKQEQEQFDCEEVR